MMKIDFFSSPDNGLLLLPDEDEDDKLPSRTTNGI